MDLCRQIIRKDSASAAQVREVDVGPRRRRRRKRRDARCTIL